MLCPKGEIGGGGGVICHVHLQYDEVMVCHFPGAIVTVYAKDSCVIMEQNVWELIVHLVCHCLEYAFAVIK